MDPAVGGGQLVVLARTAIAMLLGSVIGIERELARKPAGLRTQMLVAGAAALLVGLGHTLIGSYAHEIAGGSVTSDPLRVVGAIITGVGFLGGGTIFRRHGPEHVEGLTTAACILFSAAIGIAVALNQFVVAVGVTVLVIVALRGLQYVERRIRGGKKAGLTEA